MENIAVKIGNILNTMKAILEATQREGLFSASIQEHPDQFLGDLGEVVKTFKRYSGIDRVNDEKEMVNLVNQVRLSHGLKPLVVDSRLIKTARIKSQDMINHHYFGHHSPTMGTLGKLMEINNIKYRLVAENLAGNDSLADAHRKLMDSPDHRKNILNKSLVKVGIGIVYGGPYGMMITQHFIR